MPRKDSILKLRITDDLKRDLDQIASESGESISVIVRQALRDYLEAHRPKKPGSAAAPPDPRGSDRETDPVIYTSEPPASLRLNEPGKMGFTPVDLQTGTAGECTCGSDVIA
jgi:hypothetical protein